MGVKKHSFLGLNISEPHRMVGKVSIRYGKISKTILFGGSILELSLTFGLTNGFLIFGEMLILLSRMSPRRY
ncbi:hypothetical protein AHAS_Ahas18G0246300 [Arachis hypogaea]